MAWKKLNELWINDGEAPNVIFVKRGSPDGDFGPQPDTWTTVDLNPLGVPREAITAFLAGLLIITHGEAVEIADLRISFRHLGDTSVPLTTYESQTLEADTTGGQRSGVALWVPVVNGFIEYAYHVGTTGIYPAHSTYAINLVLQAWGK